jgi:uncharacterized protein (TIGR02145 family)
MIMKTRLSRQFVLLLPLLAVFILFSCEKNLPPRIIKTEFAREPGIGNYNFNVRVEASDPELNKLTYQWSAAKGTFTGPTDQTDALWVAPATTVDDTYQLFITVSDGDAETMDTLVIPVAALRFAKLTGFALFTGCKVPVGGAIITLDGKTDTTELDGSFGFDGVRVGRQTITAQKPDFTVGTTKLMVVEGINNALVNLTSSKYTCKLSGKITGNMTHNPKPYYKVTILNADFTDSQLSFISSADGDYEISGIPLGLARLIVRDDVRARMETLVYLETEERVFNIAVPEPFRFTDSRDNKEYEAVRISSKIWMAQNLAFIPHVSPSFDQGGIWVYGYSGFDPAAAKATENYTKYGCLYDWTTATATTHGNGRDICPSGWHLPDDDEWKSLELALGMEAVELDSTGWRFTGDVGKKIKIETGWESDGNGSNSSSFSAIPAGYRYATGGFLGMGGFATFWTSTVYDKESSYRRYLYYNQNAIGRFNDFNTSGFSVRCVKDLN